MRVRYIIDRRILTYIVSVRILHKRQGVISYFLHQLNPLLIRGMVDATLQHAATMAVRCNFDTVRSNGIVNELREHSARVHKQRPSKTIYLIVIRGELVEALLYNVVPIEILDQRHDVQAEGDDNSMDLSIVSKISLLFFYDNAQRRARLVSAVLRVSRRDTRLPLRRQKVDHLLHRTGAVHVQRDCYEVRRDRLANDVALLIGRILEQLLAEIVAEGICAGMRNISVTRGKTIPVMRSAK